MDCEYFCFAVSDLRVAATALFTADGGFPYQHYVGMWGYCFVNNTLVASVGLTMCTHYACKEVLRVWWVETMLRYQQLSRPVETLATERTGLATAGLDHRGAS